MTSTVCAAVAASGSGEGAMYLRPTTRRRLQTTLPTLLLFGAGVVILAPRLDALLGAVSLVALLS
jgi:hypothetical protein